jgi:hypothetical protein
MCKQSNQIDRTRTRLYEGKRENGCVAVTVNSNPLPHICRHSPDGFEWGYGGSGPADLARSILIDCLGEDRADRLYQDFKWAFVAKFQYEGWRITSDVIESWADNAHNGFAKSHSNVIPSQFGCKFTCAVPSA